MLRHLMTSWLLNIWKFKIWLSQEWKTLWKCNKKYFSLFHKFSLLHIQNKLVKMYQTQPLKAIKNYMQMKWNVVLWSTTVLMLAILSHVNTTIEQNWQNHIGNCLANHYTIVNLVMPPPSSEWPFGDNIIEKMMNISSPNKKPLAPKNFFYNKIMMILSKPWE